MDKNRGIGLVSRNWLERTGHSEMEELPADHEERIARARLSLEGLSLGDAYGTAAGFFPQTELDRMLGAYTDDTMMAMAIVRVLNRHGRIEQDELALEFASDCRANPNRGYGQMARQILLEIDLGRPWREIARNAFGGEGS